MSGAAFVNGEFVDDPSSARVIAMDAGLQHGVGLFETLTGGLSAGRAWAAQLDEHLERLAQSAGELGLSGALRTGPLADALLATVVRSGLERARVRVTITGGATMGAPGTARRPGDATVLIVATPATAYPPELFARGATATLADAKANPFNPHEGHKTLNYWWRLRELGLASAKGAGEALVFSVTNHLCGGCVSNALLVKHGRVVTPVARGEEARNAGVRGQGGVALPSPVRPGVVREWAMNELMGEGIVVERRAVTIADVLDADELMLTNSGWGVLPVCAVEAKPIGAGTPGEITRLLLERWALALDEARAHG